MNAKEYAYLGDAVWELLVREYFLGKQELKPQVLHNEVTSRVKASFQHDLLTKIQEELTEEELNISRRARNLSIPAARKSIQKDYRNATAFEAFIGYWYVNDKKRLKYFEEILKKYL